MKKIIFVGHSLEEIKGFSLEAKRETGYQLDRVQRGKNPLDWKPIRGLVLVLEKSGFEIKMEFIGLFM